MAMDSSHSIAEYTRNAFGGKLMPATMWAHIDQALGN